MVGQFSLVLPWPIEYVDTGSLWFQGRGGGGGGGLGGWGGAGGGKRIIVFDISSSPLFQLDSL